MIREFILLVAMLLYSAAAVAAEVTVDVQPSAGACMDPAQLPDGKALQHECIEKYKSDVRILEARMCQLPSGLWVLNYKFRCVDKAK